MTRRWHRILGDCLAVVGIVLALIGMIGATAAQADAGTIKIHAESDCSGADTDPKPGTPFWISGTGFADVSLVLWVTDGMNWDDDVVIGPAAVSGPSFCSGPYTLEEGHYKAHVDVTMGPGAKHKVFKVEGEPVTVPTTEPPTTETTPTTEPPTTETTPTTEPPTTETTPTTEPVTTPTTEAPTTTQQQVFPPGQVTTTAAPTTTSAGGLPTTGSNAPMVSLIVGLTLAAFGLTLRAVARRPA